MKEVIMVNPNIYMAVMTTAGAVGLTIPIVFFSGRIRDDLKKSLEHDISREQMECAEKKVAAFLSKNSLFPGTDILTIGKALGIGEENVSVSVSNYTRLNYKEQIFVFARQCGYLIDDMFVSMDFQAEKNEAAMKQIADYIAAALLMPLEDVYGYLEDIGYWNASNKIRIRVVKALCKKYCVGSIMALRRIREVGMLKRDKCP